MTMRTERSWDQTCKNKRHRVLFPRPPLSPRVLRKRRLTIRDELFLRKKAVKLQKLTLEKLLLPMQKENTMNISLSIFHEPIILPRSTNVRRFLSEQK